MKHTGNPHNYEPGFTIEQHRDELIDRLGAAIKRINELSNSHADLVEALQAADRVLSGVNRLGIDGVRAQIRAALAKAGEK
jgi:hypothetical protein